MGYFDGLVDASFKKDSQGKDLFFPYGILSSGYVLESEEHKNKIRKFFKTIYLVLLPTVMIVQIAVGFWLNLILLPIFYVWFYVTIKKMTKDLQRSDEKLKTSEAYRNSAKSHNLVTLVLLEIVSLLFVAGGIFILNKGTNLIIGAASFGFFGFCATAIGYMIFSKIKKN